MTILEIDFEFQKLLKDSTTPVDYLFLDPCPDCLGHGVVITGEVDDQYEKQCQCQLD